MNLISSVETQTSTYETKSAYVYNDYITDTGYINESRVKLLTMDTTGNPYGVLDIFKTPNNDSKIVV